MLDNFLLVIYRALIMPIGVMILLFVGWIHPKVRKGLKMRLKKRTIPRFEQRPIWIHTSSGEFEYAKPVIRELKERTPDRPIVVTYFSPTYQEAIERFPGVDASLPLPLDLPGPLADFFRKVNPRIGLIARTDLWPELLLQAERHGVKLILFSATLSSPLHGFKRRVKRWLFNHLNEIYCVSDEDLHYFSKLQLKTPIEVLGDTRYDQVLYRLENPRELKESLRPQAAHTLVAGSTWPEDEKVLLEGLESGLKNQKMRLILVPHEPTAGHLKSLKSQLQKAGISYDLYSEATLWASSVLIVDQLGILAELYGWGDLAFVGGSFKSGVHSVMEPLASGSLVIVGPHCRNNREAVSFQELRFHEENHPELSAVQIAANADDLWPRIEFIFKLKEGERRAIQEKIREKTRSLSGASRGLVGYLTSRHLIGVPESFANNVH